MKVARFMIRLHVDVALEDVVDQQEAERDHHVHFRLHEGSSATAKHSMANTIKAAGYTQTPDHH